MAAPSPLTWFGRRIDGRNRLRACEIAKVEPTYTRFKGEDPRDLIFLANAERRSISVGQKALAHALISHPARTAKDRRAKLVIIPMIGMYAKPLSMYSKFVNSGFSPSKFKPKLQRSESYVRDIHCRVPVNIGAPTFRPRG